MFDWNDEELTNIIWGEEWENDKCNDPYADQTEILSEKGTNEQISGTSTAERKDINKAGHGIELDRFSVYDGGGRAKAFCSDSWLAPPDPSLPKVVQLEQNALCNDASDMLREGSKSDKHSEMFEKHDDEEERDFAFHGWANIGSFEDLDRIFSDGNTIFGDLAESNVDELWSSSKDFSNFPLKLAPFSGDSNEMSQITDHNLLHPSQSSSCYQKTNDVTCNDPQNVQASIDNLEHSGGKNNMLGKEKVQANLLTEGKIQGSHKLLNDGTTVKHNATPNKGNRQRRLKSHPEPSVVNASPELHQQGSSLQKSQASQIKHFSGVHLASSIETNAMSSYPGLPVMQSSTYEAHPVIGNSSRKSENPTAKPPPMTPKEKIEKLRKRQQMRAILAIQKQQMKFNNQASVSEGAGLEGGKVAAMQNVSILPFHETSTVTEKDDPRTISMVTENSSVEESILYQLQGTVAKMDVQIRLSIRDSLFRLAKSAMQRQFPNDTSSTCGSSRDEDSGSKDLIRNLRFTRVPDMETETNPIDRTVARLLFHVGLSGRLTEACRSPSSRSIASGQDLDVFECSQMSSSQAVKSSSMLSTENQSASTSFFLSPGNPSKGENKERIEMEVN